MILTGKCHEDFNHWRFEIKKYKRDYVPEYNDIVVNHLIEQFFNTCSMYILPCPVTGSKNGYDSFPIVGWRCDILITNKDTINSYYMGYPCSEYFTMDSLNEGEKLEDINITISSNIYESKLNALEKLNEIYNNINK